MIAGFYSLNAGSIQLQGLPADFAKRLPRYPTVPMVLLGRLAVDLRFQGQRLGAVLVADALRRTYLASSNVGAAAVVVDAKNAKARSFYEHFGFRQFEGNPDRLFIPMKTIESLFDEKNPFPDQPR